MLDRSVPAPAGLQPVELGVMLVAVVCLDVKGLVMYVGCGVSACWFLLVPRTVSCVSATSDCAIDGVIGLLACCSVSASCPVALFVH